MNKTIVKVFVIIGILVLCLIVWALVFNGEDSLINGIYESVAETINDAWKGITGSENGIIKETLGDSNPNNLGEASEGAFD